MTNDEITAAVEEDFKAVSGTNNSSLSEYFHKQKKLVTNAIYGWIVLMVAIQVIASIQMSIMWGMFGSILGISVIIVTTTLNIGAMKLFTKYHNTRAINRIGKLPSQISFEVLNAIYYTIYETTREYSYRNYSPTLAELDAAYNRYLYVISTTPLDTHHD